MNNNCGCRSVMDSHNHHGRTSVKRRPGTGEMGDGLCTHYRTNSERIPSMHHSTFSENGHCDRSKTMLKLNYLDKINCDILTCITKFVSVISKHRIAVSMLLLLYLTCICLAYETSEDLRSPRSLTDKPSCASCLMRKELKEMNLEIIKTQVLSKLGMAHAPNITGKSLPKLTPEGVRNIIDSARKQTGASFPGDSDYISGMQGDDPYSGGLGDDRDDDFEWETDNGRMDWKEGITVHEESADNFHVKTKQVVAFAQSYPKLRHNWRSHNILQFKFSDKIMKHGVRKAKLFVFVKSPKYSSDTPRSKRTTDGGPKKSNQRNPFGIRFKNSDQSEINKNKTRRLKRNSIRNEDNSGVSSVLPTSTNGGKEDYIITIYKVYRNPKNTDIPGFESVSQQTIRRSDIPKGGHFVSIDVTSMIASWFKSPRDNLGFVIRGVDSDGKKIVINTADAEDDARTPFVEVHLTDPTARRVRRSVGLNCNENSEETRCCRYPLTVDFQEFGWDWIIAPKQYQANYCSGECSYMFLMKFPHTHIASLVGPTHTGNGPSVVACCAPRKMLAISMLYFDQELNIIFGTLPNMVVDRCGCS